MLENIRIVLVRPSHPGNIGAAARAMKNMGLSRLYLVNPLRFPDKEANFRASRADDVVNHAVVTSDLQSAIGDCQLVFGTSTRMRDTLQILYDPREAANKIFSEASQQVAIVFGCEKTGLTNEELNHCQYQIAIPAMPNYSSLNLAAAVQVIAYELYVKYLSVKDEVMLQSSSKRPTADELQSLFAHIEEAMIAVDFLKPNNPRRLMPRLKCLLTRAEIDKDDLDLLRGMMNAILKHI